MQANPSRLSRSPRLSRLCLAAVTAMAAMPGLASAATWTPLAHAAPSSLNTMLLLTDGTVLALASPFNTWYKLTPAADGSYINGTWSSVATMGTNRLYFASHVMPNGNLWVLGGEYTGPNLTANWSNTGEIYNTVTNSWSPIANHPESQYGDVPSMLLDGNKILAGSLSTTSAYLYDINTNTWSATGSKVLADQSDEETYAKLPGGLVMTYDLFKSIATGGAYAEVYNPKTGTWSSRSPSDGTALGSIPQLSSSAMGYELGGAMTLRTATKKGQVFYVGATGHTATYAPKANTWTPGPDIMGTLNGNKVLFGSVDGPAAGLPSGHVIISADASPTSGIFHGPTQLFDYDPDANTINPVSPALPVTLTGPSYITRMLMLPNGQMMFHASGSTAWIYTPDGAAPKANKPLVTSITYNGAGKFTMAGKHLNGVSAGSSYGDDAESDENYPIVRFANAGTVWYGRTTNWKSTGVQVGKTSTDFTLKPGTPAGVLQVVVSGAGVQSDPVCVTLTADEVAGTGAAAAVPVFACP